VPQDLSTLSLFERAVLEALGRIATALERLEAPALTPKAERRIELQRATVPSQPAKPIPDVAPSVAAANWDKEGAVTTEARKALLRELWPAGYHVQAILERFNALPGRQIDSVRLGQLASQLGFQRPQGFDGKAASRDLPPQRNAHGALGSPAAIENGLVPGLTEPLPHEPGTNGVPLSPISRPWSSIVTLAKSHGYPITGWEQLPEYNKKRLARRLQPLAIASAATYRSRFA
jgi:hypothetical protein